MKEEEQRRRARARNESRTGRQGIALHIKHTQTGVSDACVKRSCCDAWQIREMKKEAQQRWTAQHTRTSSQLSEGVRGGGGPVPLG